MTNDELREIMAVLEAQGLQPQVCDTAVPVSISTAHCGNPAELGDEGADDYLRLPKSLVGMHPEMFIPVVGGSP